MDSVIKSYIWHNRECYLVSSVERMSSAEDRSIYNEILVFTVKNKQLGDILYQDSETRGSIKRHLEICNKIHSEGVESLDK